MNNFSEAVLQKSLRIVWFIAAVGAPVGAAVSSAAFVVVDVRVDSPLISIGST